MPLFGNKKKVDSKSVPQRPWLDLALTVACLLLFACDTWLFFTTEGFEVVAELFLFMAATAVAIACCRGAARRLGAAVATEEALQAPRNLRKFGDQSWQLLVHLLMTLYAARFRGKEWKFQWKFHDF